MPQSLSVGPNFQGTVDASGGDEPSAAIKMHGDFSLIPGHPGHHAYTLSAIGSEQVPFDHMVCSERIARIACDGQQTHRTAGKRDAALVCKQTCGTVPWTGHVSVTRRCVHTDNLRLCVRRHSAVTGSSARALKALRACWPHCRGDSGHHVDGSPQLLHRPPRPQSLLAALPAGDLPGSSESSL